MYIKLNNGEVEKYPYSYGQLNADNPQTSFPTDMPDENLATWDVYPVKATQKPSVDHTQNVTEGMPVRQKTRNSDGTFKADDPETPQNEAWEWVQVWETTPASTDEIAEREAKQIAQIEKERANAYRNESDPLFFKWQRGESTEQEWLDKIAEIKTRYPKD